MPEWDFFLLGIWLLLTPVLAIAVIWQHLRIRKLKARFKPVLDMDSEIRRLETEIERRREVDERLKRESAETEAKSKSAINNAKEIYERLKKEIASLEENLDDIEYGIYQPHFDFESSDRYKREMELLRDRGKGMVRSGTAVKCLTTWTVGGSEKEGAKMIKQNMKLIMRAFNGECESALANVTWNNINKMIERIRKAHETINKLSSVMQVEITSDYLSLKCDEVRLKFECEEKKRQEIEEQRRIREQMREEEKVRREVERATQEAEKEELRYQVALERARLEAVEATGEKVLKLNERIEALQQQLIEAQKLKERALSRAQLTKSGHVYVISNIGSFGENVLKIGMTRRLDPIERIWELGDASVPFSFDIHAMMYSDDAPKLECALHSCFHEKRINVINPRKEFFHVTLDEIEQCARNMGISVTVTKLAEAKEYRESLALRSQKGSSIDVVPSHICEAAVSQVAMEEDSSIVAIRNDRKGDQDFFRTFRA